MKERKSSVYESLTDNLYLLYLWMIAILLTLFHHTYRVARQVKLNFSTQPPEVSSIPSCTSSLMRASQQGQLRRIEACRLTLSSVDVRDQKNNTPLMLAARKGHLRACLLLLQAGANVNAANQYKMTPLMYAVVGGHRGITQCLLHAGANPCYRAMPSYTAFHWAIVHNHLSLLSVLMRYGAKINARYAHGNTPILTAVIAGHERIVKWLVEHGARIDVCNDAAETVLMLAKKNQHVHVLAYLKGYIQRQRTIHSRSRRSMSLIQLRMKLASQAQKAGLDMQALAAKHTSFVELLSAECIKVTHSQEASVLDEAMSSSAVVFSAPFSSASPPSPAKNRTHATGIKVEFAKQDHCLRYAHTLMQQLETLGIVSYIVGGCPRDYLLGRRSNDVDMVACVERDRLAELLGIGVVSEYIPGLYRIFLTDCDVDIMCRPEFELECDAMSRDFTINALYLTINGDVLDPIGRGINDIRDKRIVVIGNPEQRFKADPILLLRCARMMGTYGCKLSSPLKRLVQKHARLLETIAKGRLHYELRKLFLHGHAQDNTDALLALKQLDHIFLAPVSKRLGHVKFRDWLFDKLQQTDRMVSLKQPVSMTFVHALFYVEFSTPKKGKHKAHSRKARGLEQPVAASQYHFAKMTHILKRLQSEVGPGNPSASPRLVFFANGGTTRSHHTNKEESTASTLGCCAKGDQGD